MPTPTKIKNSIGITLGAIGTLTAPVSNAESELTPEEPEVTPVYVARLNSSLSQRWSLDNTLWLNDGDELSISFVGGAISEDYARFVANNDNSFTVDAGVSGDKFRLKGCTAELDGLPIVNNVTEIPLEGKHTVKIYPDGTYGVNYFGSYNSSRYINLPLYDLNLNRPDVGVIFNAPLNDKNAGSTQVASVGNYILTLDNYTGNEWEIL